MVQDITHRMKSQSTEIKEILRKALCRGVLPSSSSSTDDPLDERGDVSNQQGNGASNQNLHRAVDSRGQARGTPATQDTWSHENGDSDRRNAPASRHANETGADDHRNDDAEKNRPLARAEQIKKGKTDSTADKGVHDAGIEPPQLRSRLSFEHRTPP